MMDYSCIEEHRILRTSPGILTSAKATVANMKIQVTTTIQGHPWDLWGLSRLFDCSNASHTLVKAIKPEGTPTFDTHDPAAISRFRAHGYDLLATITSDELVLDELGKSNVDLRDLVPVAEILISRMNGVARLLDPDYRPAKLLYLSYQAPGREGSVLHSDWTPNKGATPLGSQQEHLPFAQDALPLASKDKAVQFVLEAIALPRTWASMWLIYEAIADSVGGQHKLDGLNLVSRSELSDFRKAANNNRSLFEGMRHAKRPEPGPLIPFENAYNIVNELAIQWMASLM